MLCALGVSLYSVAAILVCPRCLTLENIKDDNKRFQCFTRMPNYATFKAIFYYLDSVALQKKKNWRGSEMETKLPSAGTRGAKAKLTLEEEFFYCPNSSALWTYFGRLSPQK